MTDLFDSGLLAVQFQDLSAAKEGSRWVGNSIVALRLFHLDVVVNLQVAVLLLIQLEVVVKVQVAVDLLKQPRHASFLGLSTSEPTR